MGDGPCRLGLACWSPACSPQEVSPWANASSVSSLRTEGSTLSPYLAVCLPVTPVGTQQMLRKQELEGSQGRLEAGPPSWDPALRQAAQSWAEPGAIGHAAKGPREAPSEDS